LLFSSLQELPPVAEALQE